MHRVFLFYVVLLVITQACQSDENTGLPSLGGVVMESGDPVSDASVTLANDASTYTTTTGPDGKFSFIDVRKDEYILTVKAQGSSDEFIQYQKNVRVLNSNSEQVIELPKATTLFEPSNVTGHSVDIKWSKSNVPDFLEYKLYRHHSSGIDETTGELIHVAMNKYDTVFTDVEVRDSETYYYRVFVRNTFGLYGGSNIVTTTTSAGNYVKNGDFEDGFNNWRTTSLPIPWILLEEDDTSPAGKMVVNINSQGSLSYSSSLSCSMSQNNFVPGETYVLSFWVKVDKPENVGAFVMLLEPGTVAAMALIDLTSETSSTWKQYRYEFIAPTLLAPPTLSIEPFLLGENKEVFYNLYFDGFSISRK